MGMYLDSGYMDFNWFYNLNLPWNFIIGGRGTGKTFGALSTMIEDGTKFLFFRRTERMIEALMKPELDPCKALNRELGTNLAFYTPKKSLCGIYKMDEDGNPIGEAFGHIAALSTFANMRGFDGEQYDVMLLDEFIPQRNERPFKSEGTALLDAYETINRNRELKGKDPLRVFCLANSNKMANPIFGELGLIRIATKMKKSGSKTYIDRNRGLGIFFLEDSPISERKKDTALYRLTGGTEYYNMSVENEFSEDMQTGICNRPIKEYNPIVSVGEICVYQHKSGDHYYVSPHKMQSPYVFGVGEIEYNKFANRFQYLKRAYIYDQVIFEDYASLVTFRLYMGFTS